VRTTTRDLVAEAVVTNPDKVLRPGMFSSVTLQTGDRMTPVIPKAAVVNKDGRSHVLVVADGRVDERVVQTGTSAGDLISVTKGLHTGDKVVIKPPEGLRNGQLVN
jgi:hypothetical protein